MPLDIRLPRPYHSEYFSRRMFSTVFLMLFTFEPTASYKISHVHHFVQALSTRSQPVALSFFLLSSHFLSIRCNRSLRDSFFNTRCIFHGWRICRVFGQRQQQTVFLSRLQKAQLPPRDWRTCIRQCFLSPSPSRSPFSSLSAPRSPCWRCST